MPEISVNGDVLKWAREERGLSRKDAADRLGIEETELASYEEGERKPLVGTLRQMANRYQINLVSLLLPQRPAPQKQLHDFRIPVGGRRPRTLTLDTLVAIQDVRDSLQAFVDLRDEDPDLVPLPKLDRMHDGETPDQLAARQRRRFAVDVKEQQHWRTPAFARNEWRRRLEAQGIFVYLKQMNPADCRGFSMIHEGLAAICINDREATPGAQTFTLLHEYCHLLRRQTGISDENRKNAVEQYCNRFAASFLIPLVPLREILKSPVGATDYRDEVIKMLANKFKVSPSAMALRLEHTGLAPRGFYESHTAAWNFPRPKKALTGPVRGPSAVDRAARIFGGHHTRTVLRAFRRGVLNAADAHHMLDVPVASFQTLGAVVE